MRLSSTIWTNNKGYWCMILPLIVVVLVPSSLAFAPSSTASSSSVFINKQTLFSASSVVDSNEGITGTGGETLKVGGGGDGDDGEEEVDVESGSFVLSEMFPSLSAPLGKLGFCTPTPIQSASAQRALSLENLLLIAPTGSGKTLAYLLPALEKIMGGDADHGSTVLVVAPTRELSVQLMRDATSVLTHLPPPPDNSRRRLEDAVLLAVRGVDVPTTEQLNNASFLIGTPPEILTVLSKVPGGLEFIAGDVLSSIILDEVDILLPSRARPKNLRTSLDANGKKKANSAQEQRRQQEQKRKLNAAKRKGLELSSNTQQELTPTDVILKLIASRRQVEASTGNEFTMADTTTKPYQVIAGSATASRRTLDRLNKSLRDAAIDASSTVDTVWLNKVQSCRPLNTNTDPSPILDGNVEQTESQQQQQHTIRAVTVPEQVKHQYIALSKEEASSPMSVLTAVAKAANDVLKPQSALIFLCGDFGKSVATTSAAAPQSPANRRMPANAQLTRAKKKVIQQKKRRSETAATKARNTPAGISARQVCSTLAKLGLDALPLHVALGLELNAKKQDEEKINSDTDPSFLVTFEGSARGLHIDNIDTVFVVGRPVSAASYLHLAGRVGRASANDNGDVVINPGTVVSLCTKGSAKELAKWTKQIGGTDLEQLLL